MTLSNCHPRFVAFYNAADDATRGAIEAFYQSTDDGTHKNREYARLYATLEYARDNFGYEFVA